MRFDESSADCRVFTYKDGLLSPMGHDLELRVARFTIDVEGERIEARFAADSLQVVAGSGGAVPLGARDKATIEETVAGEILQARRHPYIEYHATLGDEIRGSLMLLGKSRPVTCKHLIEGKRHVAEARIHQPDFGIKPYRAMLGALRLKPDLDVRVTISA
jgi:hypothetical protein